MKKLSKIFAVVLVLAMALSMMPFGAAAAEEKSVKLTADNMGLSAYAAGTTTVDGLALGYTELGSYGDGIQMRQKNGNIASLWNTAAMPGKITKIVFTWSATKTNGYSNADAFDITFGNAMKEATYTAKLSTVKGDALATYTITPDAGEYTYFCITLNLSYSFYWDSIEIFYEEATTGGDNTPDNTGDNTAIVAMTTAMVMSVAALAVLVIGKKRMF